MAESEFDAVQIPLNVFDWEKIENGEMEQLHKAGKAVFTRSVFLQGLVFLDPEKLPAKMQFCKPVLASLAMGAAVWLVYSKQDLGVLAGTVLSVLTGIVVYGVLCVVLRQKDIAEFFKKITGGLKND